MDFQCVHCKLTFEKAVSDEEALAETKEIFGEAALMQPLVTVCDDCFKIFMEWYVKHEQKQ